MRSLDRARIFWFKGIFRLCMGLVVVGIIILGAAERTAAASSATGSAPDIKAFSADPLTLPDGGHTVYTFEVYDAMKIQVIEAGDIIKEINGAPSTTNKGTATGRTTYQIRTGSSNTFEAMLVASNAGGTQKKTLTLTYATKFQPKPAPPPAGQTGATDNRTVKHEPKWGPQSSAPVTLTSSTALSPRTGSPYVPTFAECPSGCNCLTPDQAAEYGFKQKCSEDRCFSADNQVKSYCYSKLATGWCCKDGKVTPATKDQCAQAGGSWYATEAEANKACQLPMGWCCAGGKVYQATKDQCAQAGGSWYATAAEANNACQSLVWCCAGGKVYQATKDQCAQVGGSGYATEAEAIKVCQSGWFCKDGKVYQGSQAQATQAGAAWYATQAEAIKACQTCWCCTGGRYGQTTTDACAKMGGTCYATQAQASERCQPVGGCCAGSNVSQSTQTQCAQVGGKWYSSVTEAQQACQPPTYYCCSNGQVYKSTTLGRGCYTSLTEATAACQPTYWCCSNGQVYQSKTPGRGCYATQAEAIKACQKVLAPPILK